uniref:Uncharacterized protein n=1 Tax=Clytia hemisphaerica TaxID=252671 RepID=A0A7M5XBN5_9CNID
MVRTQRERKPSAKLADNIGEDTGPLLRILYTVEESNGKRMQQTLPYSRLKPKCLTTGEEVHVKDLAELRHYNFLYPHSDVYYEAILMEIKKKKRTMTDVPISEDSLEMLNDSNAATTHPSQGGKTTKQKKKKQKCNNDEFKQQVDGRKKPAGIEVENLTNNGQGDVEAITAQKQKAKDNQTKQAKAKATKMLTQEILEKKEASIKINMSGDLLDKFVDMDEINYQANDMNDSEDFEIIQTNVDQQQNTEFKPPKQYQPSYQHNSSQFKFPPSQESTQIKPPPPPPPQQFQQPQVAKRKTVLDQATPPFRNHQEYTEAQRNMDLAPAPLKLPNSDFVQERSPVYHHLETKKVSCSRCLATNKELRELKEKLKQKDKQLNCIKKLVPDILTSLAEITHHAESDNPYVEVSQESDLGHEELLDSNLYSNKMSTPKSSVNKPKVIRKTTPLIVEQPAYSAPKLPSSKSPQSIGAKFKQLNEFAPHIILTPDDMKRLQVQSSNLTNWRPFVNEILDILFTKEELARSCAMGSTDRKTGNQRPALNPTLIADLK